MERQKGKDVLTRRNFDITRAQKNMHLHIRNFVYMQTRAFIN